MADFGQQVESNINPWLTFYQSQDASNRGIADTLANKLASNTLGSRTDIAANTAEAGGLANQFATEHNPLEILQLRQQLGLESSPNMERLMGVITGQSGSTGGAAVPAAFLPYYQEASARTGIPASVLIAQGQQESGMNPAAVGSAGEIGLHQIKPSTAKDPGFGMSGIDPATLRDPRTNINFAADYLKARAGPRADFSNPTTVAAALKNYNGGGDPNYVQNVLHRMSGAPVVTPGPRVNSDAPPPPITTAATTSERVPLPENHNFDHAIDVSGGISQAILNAPPEQRPELWAKYRQTMVDAGALNAPVDYPGDQALALMSKAATDPTARAQVIAAHRGVAAPGSVQVAGPGAPVAPQPASDAAMAAPLPAVAPDSGPASAAPGAPVSAAPPPIPNENPMLAMAAPAGGQAPVNAMMPTATPVAAPASPTAAPPATGMNSPQVIQAQQLLRKAAQLGLIAAQTPNDPRVKATAEAAITDLKARAALLMQADSVTYDPNTGIGTKAITGERTNAPTPALNYQPDPNNPGILISPGAKPVVLPPGRATTLPDGSTWVTGPGGTFKMVRGPNLEGASAAATAAAGGKAAAQAAAKTKEALIPLARSSGQAIGNIDYGLAQLDAAAKAGIPTGYFAPSLATAAAAAKSIGIKIPGVDPSAVSDIQTASKTLAVVSGAILQNIIGKGEITEGKIEAFIHAQPGIINDPQATHRILNWARSQFTYDHEMAMDGLANVDPKSGQLPPGWQAGYITKHGAAPIYDPVSGEMRQPDGQAPSREPPPESKSASSAPPLADRKVGTVYPTPKGPMSWTGTGWIPAPGH
jgi:transglycosylase-like protein with SLT domain